MRSGASGRSTQQIRHAYLGPAAGLVTCLLLLLAATTPAASASARQSHHVFAAPSYVALTFDDGPSIYTPGVLSVLQRFHISATFFVVGEHVVQYPSYIRAEVAGGNEIGNHTYTHADLVYLGNSDIRTELGATQQAIWSAVHVTPRWFRPPYGDTNSRVTQVAATLKLRPMLWNVDPRDWSLPGVGAIVATVLAQVRPGSVIIMHDGGGNRSETVAALPYVIQTLGARGYRFVTVSQLFGAAPIPPPCDEKAGAKWFSSRGVSAAPTHAIYHAWLSDYCAGVNLGPATSHEYWLRTGVVAQNFARTAHRIEWAAGSGAIRVRIIRSWATDEFDRLGIEPRRHTPITASWFRLFYTGYDEGAALEEPRLADGVTTQCFQRACAAARGSRVTWHS